MCKNKFTPIFGSYGQPLICFICGGEIVGETPIIEKDYSIFFCEHDHMIRGLNLEELIGMHPVKAKKRKVKK